MLILWEQYFHSSKTFLKVRKGQWKWENGLTKMHQDSFFFAELTAQAFSHLPQPRSVVKCILRNSQVLHQFLLDLHLEM